MRFQVGDMVFTRDGRPSLVLGRKETGHVQLQRKGEQFEEKRKIGIINGLTPDNRVRFEGIVKDLKQTKDPEVRLSQLQSKVKELGANPKNMVLKRYLEGEMSYIMNSEGVHPKTFEVEEGNII